MRLSLLRNTRGAVLVFVALGSFALLGLAGLALDGGMAYLTRAKMSRAVDAGTLAAARSLRQGQTLATAQAFAVAAANGVVLGGATALTIEFGTNAKLQQTVLMRARRTIPLLFSRVLGHNEMTIGAVAEATVPPIDMVLVVDRSGSMQTQNAWIPLQNAVKNFVKLFDDSIDQLGLTSFQTRANNDVLLAHQFKGAITSEISAMNSLGYTNTGEGLRLGLVQIQRPNVRPGAAKVVVFFTDGRPTAIRGMVGSPGDIRDRIIIVNTVDDNLVSGYYNNPDLLPMTGWGTINGCQRVATCFGTWTEASVRNQARANGLTAADALRAAGVYVYTIALGNLKATDPLLQPDLAYLQDIANENHRVHPTQPAGRSYFAPTAAELDAVFQALAKDLLVRLSR